MHKKCIKFPSTCENINWMLNGKTGHKVKFDKVMTISTLLYNNENQATKVHLQDTDNWDMFLCKVHIVQNKMSFTMQL